MIEWKPDIARWIQVYEVIKDRIESGQYDKPGEADDGKIPSVLQLQAEFGIATATAQKVLHKLRTEGLTRTDPGIGTFVKRSDTL